ncbi:Uncharacterised protein [Dermatophilus congolensis]|uniref:Uncharacterized protein n=1 Tax=Dermatophilus congolensis TaxID=1863 RepID=A0AA46BLN5_9MICO|nr:Uncharacterised protein [Dermatophilus congolensis]
MAVFVRWCLVFFAGRGVFGCGLVEVLQGLGDDGEEVADDAQVGFVEDEGVGVAVDDDDGGGGAHSCYVLHGTGDAAGDVEAWRD